MNFGHFPCKDCKKVFLGHIYNGHGRCDDCRRFRFATGRNSVRVDCIVCKQTGYCEARFVKNNTCTQCARRAYKAMYPAYINFCLESIAEWEKQYTIRSAARVGKTFAMKNLGRVMLDRDPDGRYYIFACENKLPWG